MRPNQTSPFAIALGFLLITACGTSPESAASAHAGTSAMTTAGSAALGGKATTGGNTSTARGGAGGTGNYASGSDVASLGGSESTAATGGNSSSATYVSGGANLGGMKNESIASVAGGTRPAGGSSSAGAGGTRAATGGTRAATGGSSRGSESGGAPIAAGGTAVTGGATGRAAGGAHAGDTSVAGSASQLCDVGVWDGVVKPVPLTLTGNISAHDPTMTVSNGVYYRYWTGDGILSAKSTNLTNWTNAASVYKNGYSAWTNDWLAKIPGETFNFPWAPDVSYFNGQYHIYAAFSAKFGDNISCINHLSTSDLAAGNWVDHGSVICSDGTENYNAIDPDIGLDTAGAPFMAFGSFWDGIMGMALNADGTRAGTTLTRLASASQIEAPVLFYRCGYYYLFVSFGICCPGENRTIDQLSYRVVVGRSKSIMGPYVDRSGKAMLDGGGTLMVQGDHVTYAAAGHSDVMVSGNKIYHLYHAYLQTNGNAQLRIVEMPFDSEGWPVPAAGP